MQLELSADQLLLRDATREFLSDHAPLTAVRRLAEQGRGFDPQWWCRGCDLGWTSMLIAPEHGGGSVSGDGVLDLMIIAEEMGRMVSPGPLVVTNVVAAALSDDGAGGRHAAVIEALRSGAVVASWAVYEPGRGWAPAAISLQGRAVDGGFVLTGVKDRVEFGDQADVFLVTASLGGSLAQFVVPADSAGLTVTADESLDLVRRFSTLSFDQVRVGRHSMVGDPATAASAVERQLQLAVVLQCAELAGLAGRVFEFTRQWAADRYSFGRPLASYQALKHRFADMLLWLEACRATTEAAGEAVTARRGDAAELVGVAKSYVGQRATDLVQDCVQLHGGIGVTWEHDIHLYLRRATVDRVMWGSPSEHRRRLADVIGV